MLWFFICHKYLNNILHVDFCNTDVVNRYSKTEPAEMRHL